MHVALLRGINVGGKNKLPMKDLIAIFEGIGCRDVRNYIQSGNIVFDAPAKILTKIPALVSGEIKKRFGFDAPVVVRSASELRKISKGNPFLSAGEPSEAAHVLFLSDEPTKAAVSLLDEHRSPPDRFAVRGANVYLFCPNGVAKTKLTNAYFDSKLKTLSTGRNWRTLLALIEMTANVT